MKQFCPQGLSAFIQDRPISERGLPETWRKIVLSADMGNDILAAANALQRHYKMNLDYAPDLSHGVHNDIWGAGKEANLGSYFYMLRLCVNIPCGPWCEDTRYKQVMESLSEMLAVESPDPCPLFQELLPRMISEAILVARCVCVCGGGPNRLCLRGPLHVRGALSAQAQPHYKTQVCLRQARASKGVQLSLRGGGGTSQQAEGPARALSPP